MTGKDNLIPMNERTKGEQREIARKGGKASGQARRRKRTMREAAQLILYSRVSPEIAATLMQYGIEEQDCTNMVLLMAKAVQMAADGNMRAAEFIRDVLGENPQFAIYEKKLELMIADKQPARNITDDWVDAILAADENGGVIDKQVFDRMALQGEMEG